VTCAEFELLAVSDEPGERELALEHAATCPRCAETLAGWRRLDELVGDWRREQPEAPPFLGTRIARAAEAAESAAPQVRPASKRLTPRRHQPALRRSGRSARTWPAVAAAAAAVLAVVAGLSLRSANAGPAAASGGLLAAEALREAENAERSHARAVAKLEAAVQPLLERGTDPNVPAEQAALLLAYRDRLQFLDRTLDEVEGFLQENPYNAKARTLLLAGYIEKREILGEVLALAAKNPDLGGTAS